MAPIPPLFTIPIPPSSGNITCTLHSPQIYLLTWTSPLDNRLTPAFCNALLLCLDIIEHRHPTGCVVTTSSIPKFYSNGLDYASAIKDPGFFPDVLYPLWRRFLTYPMPTIALLPGHAFAGGLMTAMMHDYRLFCPPSPPKKAYLCLNELDFGAPLTAPMTSIFRSKIPSPLTFRKMVLEAKRFTASEALGEGIVDGVVEEEGGWADVVRFVEERGLEGRGKTGVYGRLKGEMWKETVQDLDGHEEERKQVGERDGGDQRRKEEGLRRVEAWEAGGKVSAKL